MSAIVLDIGHMCYDSFEGGDARVDSCARTDQLR